MTDGNLEHNFEEHQAAFTQQVLMLNPIFLFIQFLSWHGNSLMQPQSDFGVSGL